MNIIFRVFLATVLIVICANWSGSETSIDGPTQQAVNFKGTIIPLQGEPITAENISIGRMYKQIPVYQAPEQNSQELTNQVTNRLSSDPREGIVSRIDLADIYQIVVHNPDTVWTYQKQNHNRQVEYIVITVISNDSQKTQNNYLIDVDRKITCNEIKTLCDQAQSTASNDKTKKQTVISNKEIPLPAIKSLTISCFGPRQADTEKNQISQPCPICPVMSPRTAQ